MFVGSQDEIRYLHEMPEWIMIFFRIKLCNWLLKWNILNINPLDRGMIYRYIMDLNSRLTRKWNQDTKAKEFTESCIAYICNNDKTMWSKNDVFLFYLLSLYIISHFYIRSMFFYSSPPPNTTIKHRADWHTR